MSIPWSAIASTGLSLAGNLFGGKEQTQTQAQTQQQTNLPPQAMMPEQQALMQMMIQNMMAGGGDYGFAGAYDQGIATARRQSERMGMSPGDGGYSRLSADALTQAVLQDSINRRNFSMGLATGRVPMFSPGGTTTSTGSITGNAGNNAWDALGDLGQAGLAYSFRNKNTSVDPNVDNGMPDEVFPTATYTVPAGGSPQAPNFGSWGVNQSGGGWQQQ